MLATILIHVPFVLLPLQAAEPTRDCLLEVFPLHVIEDRTLSEFHTNVDAYMLLHRRLARAMSVVEPAGEEGVFFSDGLRTAIAAARPLAAPGDFFTRPVAEVIRSRIELMLQHRNPAAPLTYEPLPGEPGPVVNAAPPPDVVPVWWLPFADNLPELPPELEYAFWGGDLLLIDVPANLVVDVMTEALPPGRPPRIGYQ